MGSLGGVVNRRTTPHLFKPFEAHGKGPRTKTCLIGSHVVLSGDAITKIGLKRFVLPTRVGKAHRQCVISHPNRPGVVGCKLLGIESREQEQWRTAVTVELKTSLDPEKPNMAQSVRHAAWQQESREQPARMRAKRTKI